MIPRSYDCRIKEFALSADSSVFLSNSILVASASRYCPSPETADAIASLKRDSPKRVCFLVMTTSELNPRLSQLCGVPHNCDYADFGIMQTETSEPSECPGKLPNFDA